jgi:hypothetical protein
VPTLDLRFADNRSLTDAVTGASLVTFTRASDGTYVDSAGVIQTAATDVPRFDHNPTTLESLGLLVEEQRANLLQRSEEFDDAYWSKIDASISANATASPAGATTADRLIDANTNGLHYAIRAVTVVANTAHAYSIYVKAGEYSRCRIRFGKQGSPFTRIGIIVNLNDGTITNSDVGTPTSVAVRSAVNVGGGWYRISVAGVFDTTSTDGYIEATIVDNSGNAIFTGTGTDGLFIWGAQLEVGTFPTSYIPTTTAAVTRSADVASIGSSAFSSWYRQDEGTMFAGYQGPQVSVPGSRRVATANDGSFSNLIMHVASNGGGTSANFVSIVTSDVAQTADPSSAYTSAAQQGALAYALNSIGFSRNGGAPSLDTSANIPSVNVLNIGAGPTNTSILNGTIRRLVYWGQRLPNNVLQAITQ